MPETPPSAAKTKEPTPDEISTALDTMLALPVEKRKALVAVLIPKSDDESLDAEQARVLLKEDPEKFHALVDAGKLKAI